MADDMTVSHGRSHPRRADVADREAPVDRGWVRAGDRWMWVA